jgi:hypothetical protein
MTKAPRARGKSASKIAAAATPPASTIPPPPRASPTRKLGQLMELMRREGGATLPELCEATGWQPHSVRRAIAGGLKKKHGLEVASTKADGVRRYSIATPEAEG